jgi:hypothetical protein
VAYEGARFCGAACSQLHEMCNHPPGKCSCGNTLSKTHDIEHPGECCDCFDVRLKGDS